MESRFVCLIFRHASGVAWRWPPAGQAASVAITYVLSPGGGGLEGSGVGADNRVQRLTLRRAP
ncbi:MAG: hypothetical protein A3I17_04380 [Candidatus Rokubacteria bacterium RIFCSPLOWO2_02_FULL_72_37]|nr:MAG: hypothetical protein A3I17_04380 [Candidatus Rokubacteria bacterium RIFCSPLOWO2_02_FULL_72_37]